MHSCTSGSDAAHCVAREMKAIALVLLTVLGAEVALRMKENSLSLNLRHISEVPALARQLHSGTQPRILFLGNSYTRRDTDLNAVADAFTKAGIPELNAAKVALDATSVIDWYYALRTFFVDADLTPDIVVVGFTINRHLSDASPIDVRLLSRRFCRTRHVAEIFRHDMKTAGDRILFLLSRASSVIGNQCHVRQRLLDKVIPCYRFGVGEVSRLSRPDTSTAYDGMHGFTRLDRFLALMRDRCIVPIFVAMPAPRWEDFDPDLESTIVASGGTFIDCRFVPGIGPTDFVDGCYLNESAAGTYSRQIAGELAMIINAQRGRHRQ